MASLFLLSLGCNKNLVDSEIMLGKLKNYDLIDDASKADVIILNTCGFINSAKEESLRNIFELNSVRKADSLLIVTGCFIQRYKDELQKELPEVDLFTGVGDYNKIDELIETKQSRFSDKVYLQQDEERIISNSNFHAYIKLSEGCNQRCSFCAIPAFKGKLQSRQIKDIVKEIKSLCQDGFYDFSFIAQDSSSYLRDFDIKDGLISLIDEVEKIDGVKSARILYLYPTTTSDEIIDKIISSKIFQNYFDMPIQHIEDKMLKIMKRGHLSHRLKEQFLKMTQADDAFVRTTFIVGHPGESEEDFESLCNFIKDSKFDRINVFAYSDEEDTTAFLREDKIDEKTINKRLNKITPLIEKKQKSSLDKEVGKKIQVVIEGQSSEGEFFLNARKLQWAPEIDGEILINDTEIKDIKIGKVYVAKVSQRVGDKLLATIEKELF